MLFRSLWNNWFFGNTIEFLLRAFVIHYHPIAQQSATITGRTKATTTPLQIHTLPIPLYDEITTIHIPHQQDILRNPIFQNFPISRFSNQNANFNIYATLLLYNIISCKLPIQFIHHIVLPWDLSANWNNPASQWELFGHPNYPFPITILVHTHNRVDLLRHTLQIGRAHV